MDKHLNYRHDIDGLRAIAVISVILYHFNIPYFKGGFIGVDIFFVISGFLITKNIIKLVDGNAFSFSEFYFRRIRRLIPALLVTIAITFIASYYILSPEDMGSLSGSVVYAIVGASNIYFWLQSGYFDSFASLKPLLHTWSLGVEIQFYFLWPVFLWLTCKFIKKNQPRTIIVVLFVLISCAISILQSFNETTTAFFLTPYRMHEFAIGALAFFFHVPNKNIAKNILYSIGVFSVLLSVLTFNITAIVFPGYMVLIPCIGAALMIISGGDSKLSVITNNKAAAHIGEISYSLYLVHWPIFVLTSYIVIFPLNNFQIIGGIAATIICAYVLYYLVETRFRSPVNAKLSGSSFALSCTMTGMLISVVAASCWGNNGWDWRIPEEIRNVNNIDKSLTKDYTWKIQPHLDAKIGFDMHDKRKKLLVIGDSQSADFINAMTESGTIEKYDVVARTVVNVCGTPYVAPNKIDLFLSSTNKMTSSNPKFIATCKRQFDRLMNKDLLESADIIVLAMYYPHNLIDYVKEGVKDIQKNTNAKFFVLGRKNLSKSSIAIINSFQRINGIDKFASKFKERTTTLANDRMRGIDGITFIDMMGLICPLKESCLVMDKQNNPLLYDPAHFTKYGAEYFGPQIAKYIN